MAQCAEWTLNKIEITDNLYNSAVRSKLSKEIFSELVKTLGFSIDFQRELRKGDIFETLYSQKIDLITNEIIESKPIHYISASLKDNNLKLVRKLFLPYFYESHLKIS